MLIKNYIPGEEKKENDDKESISRLTVLKIPTVLVLCK